ncbi:MAG: ZIP family metal transporter [Chlorobiaceae bacterium]|nr:ZIP family metal transporter [Chlorobiaceae bacterium]NTW11143.1 ZIP family metal transporter [Chlorobiaceae bacterium]
MQIWIYSLVSVFIVSMLSLVGLIAFPFGKEKIGRFLIWAVAFAAGTLLGDAFLHLIPEATRRGTSIEVSMSFLGGILAFFILEKFIHWHHCHDVECEEKKESFPYVILVGEAVHNFIDGMIIAASYLVDIPLGIATTLAVVSHEIPHEIGDFASMLYGGFSKGKALLYNVLAGMVAIFGALFVLTIKIDAIGTTKYLVPFAAGSFIYVAMADIIPELHKTTRPLHSLVQLGCISCGIALMYLLLVLE